MKTVYVKQFLQRGVVFGGFGPIILGIVFWILSLTIPDFSLKGGEVMLAILSTYALAFVQAGASVFNQIDEWPLMKSLACHFGSLYVVYVGCYLLNSWIPFEPMVILIFTAIFVATYAIVWLTVFLCVKAFSRRCNAKLK